MKRSVTLTALVALVALSPTAALAKSKVKKPFVLVKGEPADSAPKGKPTPAREQVEAGLTWLAKKQDPDGRWARNRKGKHDDDRDAIPTASALLAFLGNGHTHRFGKYKRVVNRGLRWLKAKGRASGGVWGAKSDAPVLSQAAACEALAQAYAISRDFTLKPHLERALGVLLDMESPQGGFGFEPKKAPNALATTQVVLALKAFKLSGIKVPSAVFGKARDFLKSCTGRDGQVGFSAPGQGISLGVAFKKKKEEPARVPLFTAASLISRIFCGERRSEPALRQGRKLLTLPHPDRDEPVYTYLATYAAYQFGGSTWDTWSNALRIALGKRRQADGSWKAAGLMRKLGGAAGTTALDLQTLEIILRYERMSGRR